MAGIAFLIALLLGGGAFLFHQAAGEISVGTQWASDVCSTSQMFCHHPEYLACAAGVMLVIATRLAIGVSGPLGLTSPSANLTPASWRQDHMTSPSALAPFVISASAWP